MEQYKDWAPTPFDNTGAFLTHARSDDPDDRGEWYVVPTMRTRDSNPVEESNFHAALALLGDESDTVEVHRFGHWGPGWFEIILVHPDRKQEVSDIHARLMNYPLLDEDDLSNREYADAMEAWDNYAARDFSEHLMQRLAEYCDISEDVDDWDDFYEHGVHIPDAFDDDMWKIATKCGMDFESHSDGPYFSYDVQITQGLLDDLGIAFLPHDCPRCGNPIAPNTVCRIETCKLAYFPPQPATQGELPL